MDSSSSDLFSSPALASAGSSMPSNAVTEQDIQFAASAKKDFQDRNLEACLNSLGALKLSRAEDPLVAQNLAVVRFEKKELTVDGILKELSAVRKQRGAAGEFEECTHVALVYNLALAHFLKRNFEMAEQLLSKLRDTCGSSSTPVLVNFVLPLLASVSILLNMPAQALSCLNAIGGGDIDRIKAVGAAGGRKHGSLMLTRAQALVMSRQQKTFKKDVKSSDLELGEQLTADFLKANMEYLKGNLKKAHKLLTPSNERSSAMTPYLNTLFYNNLGCITLLLGKASLAHHYFTQAFSSHHVQTTSQTEASAVELQQRTDFNVLVKKSEIMYNHSLARLHCRCYKDALEGFLRTVPYFRSSPHLWLHMAECCIAECAQNEPQIQTILKKQEVPKGAGGMNRADQRDALMANFKVLGGGFPPEKQMVVLNCQKTDHGVPNLFSTDANGMSSRPALTFQFAMHCLNSALFLIGMKETADKETPRRMPLTSKFVLLRAVVLVKAAYVSLRLNDPVMTVRYAEEVLHLPRSAVPGGYIALAHLYCAEGLILNDRISEAMAMLEPSVLEDVSFDADSVKDDNGGGNGSDGHAKRAAAGVVSANVFALQATKALFTFNVAVAQLHRGLLDKAEASLEQLWNSKATQQFASQVFMARLYVQIKKGNLEACRELILKDCMVYTGL